MQPVTYPPLSTPRMMSGARPFTPHSCHLPLNSGVRTAPDARAAIQTQPARGGMDEMDSQSAKSAASAIAGYQTEISRAWSRKPKIWPFRAGNPPREAFWAGSQQQRRPQSPGNRGTHGAHRLVTRNGSKERWWVPSPANRHGTSRKKHDIERSFSGSEF